MTATTRHDAGTRLRIGALNDVLAVTERGREDDFRAWIHGTGAAADAARERMAVWDVAQRAVLAVLSTWCDLGHDAAGEHPEAPR